MAAQKVVVHLYAEDIKDELKQEILNEVLADIFLYPDATGVHLHGVEFKVIAPTQISYKELAEYLIETFHEGDKSAKTGMKSFIEAADMIRKTLTDEE